MTFKLSAIALLVGVAFAGTASAQAQFASSGASAQRNTILNEYAALCPGGAGTAQYFRSANIAAEGSQNVYAVRCGAAGDVFSFDQDGGSWRGWAVNDTALATIQSQAAGLGLSPVRYLDPSVTPACPVAGASSIPSAGNCGVGATKLVGETGAPAFVSIGFSDMAPEFMDGDAAYPSVDTGAALNRPVGLPWTPIGSVRKFPSFGVVFGIGVSRPLYEKLQDDQGINASACLATGGGRDLSNAACAPVISKDQYRSIVTNNFGTLANTYDGLFNTGANRTGVTVQLERRDIGSGTQAASNQHFAGAGCSPYFGAVADNGEINGNSGSRVITLNNATSDVISRLGSTTEWRIGVVARDQSPSGTSNWGFLKLSDGAEKGNTYPTPIFGAYPSQNNSARGLYGFWTVGWGFCRPGVTGAIATLCNKVDSTDPAYVFTPTNQGALRLTALAGPAPAALGNGIVPNGTYYIKEGLAGQCTGAVAN